MIRRDVGMNMKERVKRKAEDVENIAMGKIYRRSD